MSDDREIRESLQSAADRSHAAVLYAVIASYAPPPWSEVMWVVWFVTTCLCLRSLVVWWRLRSARAAAVASSGGGSADELRGAAERTNDKSPFLTILSLMIDVATCPWLRIETMRVLTLMAEGKITHRVALAALDTGDMTRARRSASDLMVLAALAALAASYAFPNVKTLLWVLAGLFAGLSLLSLYSWWVLFWVHQRALDDVRDANASTERAQDARTSMVKGDGR